MLKIIYRIFIRIVEILLPVIGTCNTKIGLGVKGRKKTWSILEKTRHTVLPKIWVHAASLGEYEQVVPILEQIDRNQYHVVLTFFSPSGYEVKKHTQLVDTVCYLPLDTYKNAQKFITLVQPSCCIMVKYEFWPNYLDALQQYKVPTFLISAVFRDNMIFHKWYGKWMKKGLNTFDHFFVQNPNSIKVLKELGFTNSSVSGDTRFDRAAQLLLQDNSISLFESFIQEDKCIVVGSSWPEDIQIMSTWLQENEKNKHYKIIIAPHEVHDTAIKKLKEQLGFNPLLWSDIHDLDKTPTSSQCIVIDRIGLLTRAYSYASIAYVGGAMGTKGLHNILEAATYSIPIIIGKHFEKFPEAQNLQQLGGLQSVTNSTEFKQVTQLLLQDDTARKNTGMICGEWIRTNTGAINHIKNHIIEEHENIFTA